MKQGCFRRGFVAEHDGRMCCRELEGEAFKCGKSHWGSNCKCGRSTCPYEFVVMWGFVWTLNPGGMMSFSGRGRDHAVRPGSMHHDYPCDMCPNGRRSVYEVVRQENDKARRLFSNFSKRTEEVVDQFCTVARRLVDILPEVEHGTVLQLGSPVLSLPDPVGFITFQDQASHEDSAAAFYKQKERYQGAKYALKSLVGSLIMFAFLKVTLARSDWEAASTLWIRWLPFLADRTC